MKKTLIFAGLFSIAGLFVQADAFAQQKDTYKKTEKHYSKKDKFQRLDLSESQKEQIEVIQKKYDAEVAALNKKKLTADERDRRLEKLKADKKAKIRAVLTPEQIQKMDKMKEKRKDKMNKKHHEANSRYNQDQKGRRQGKEMSIRHREEIRAIATNPNLTTEQKKEQIQALKAKQKEERMKVSSEREKIDFKIER